jgi:HK97 family phage portal protein
MRFLPSLFGGRRPARPAPGQMLETKLLLSAYYTSMLNAGVSISEAARGWPVEKAISQGYDRVIWCYKAVATIGENCAREDVPFEVITGEGADLEVIEDHPISRLLNGQANPIETGEVFLERLSAQLLLSPKGAFVEVIKSNAGTPVRLDLLPPGRTRIVPGNENLIECFEVRRPSGTCYYLEPDRVRWIRKPHPIDPFSGVTPLEAAGLSIELDYFARLYNVSFMRNDGRPGGIVGITGPDGGGGGLNETDLEELESRFGKGPTEAGKISVVEGNISYADLAAKPRDSQYQGVSANAKTEILAAFGVPESVLGNSSERTYANAEAEKYHFWVTTMLPHLSRIASAFLVDCDDGQKPQFNVDKIDVLELPARERRKEAREEVALGLRSILSYLRIAGRGDEVEDTVHTRALWLPAGKMELPAFAADAEEIAGEMAAGAAAAEPVSAEDGPGLPQLDEAGQRMGNTGPAPVDAPNSPELFGGGTGGNAEYTRRPQPATARKDAAVVFTTESFHPGTDFVAVTEATIYGALTALVPGWTDRARTRLRAPRTRKGTRHFSPEFPDDTRLGTKALDAAYVVDEAAWAADAEAALRPLIEEAAVAVATAALEPEVAGSRVAEAAREAAGAALPALVGGVTWQARRAARAIAEADASGADLDQVAGALAAAGGDLRQWARTAAATAALTAVEAGQDAADRQAVTAVAS